MVNCDDTKISLEVSSSTLPGFYAFCGDAGDFDSVLACMFQTIGYKLGSKVCNGLDQFEDGEKIHFEKRKQLCPEVVKNAWGACNASVTAVGMQSSAAKECLDGLNLAVDDKIQLKNAMSLYAR